MTEYARAQAGNPDALAALVRRHIPLVQALCGRFSYSQDAFQWGCVGLVKAIRRFREEEGNQFSTYAVPVILGEMRRAQSHTLGWRSRAALKKAREYEENILRCTGKRPHISDTAAHAGISPEELMLLMERDQPPVYDETGAVLSSLPDPRSQDFIIRFLIRDALDRLPQREKWIIRQRFIFLRTQQEIACALGTTQSTVSRLEKKARNSFIAAWSE